VAVLGSSSELHPELTAQPLIDDVPTALPVVAYVSPQADETVRRLERAGRPTFRTPEGCAAALALAFACSAGRRPAPAVAAASPDVPAWLPAAGGPLNEDEASRLFAAAGVPMARARVAQTVEEAREAAKSLGYPVALKALSRHLLHKSERGALALGVADDAAVGTEFRRLVGAVPDAEGVLVMEMVPPGVELLVGVRRDPVLGPALAVGIGGTATEVYEDVALRVLPIGRDDAEEMLAELRGAALLRGWRGRPRADLPAATAAILAFARLADALGDRLVEAEINPLVVLPEGHGVRGVDAIAVLAGAVVDPEVSPGGGEA
jgi:hypothetical protein